MSADITKAKTWYGLKLGEVIELADNRQFLTRVPGGWIMETVFEFHNINQIIDTFIPFSDEFREHK